VALQQPLDRLAQVLQQVPAVRDLKRLRRPFGGGLGVGRPAVAGDDLDAGVFLQPRRQRGAVPAHQDVEDAAALQVDEDGAVALALADGPVIDADVAGRRGGLIGGGLDAAQQGVRAGRHVQALGEAGAWLTTEGEADGAVGVGQPGGCAGVGVEQLREALAEDGPRATGVEAAEAADDQAQGQGPVVAGEVGHRAAVAAVDPIRTGAAARTSRGGRR
jgi:hypothetical protein